MERPKLRRIDLAKVWPPHGPGVLATMSEGQWDDLLAGLYAGGAVLLEIGPDGATPVRAYQDQVQGPAPGPQKPGGPPPLDGSFRRSPRG